MFKMLKKKLIQEIFIRFKNKVSQPKGELIYTSPYTLLVAVVLSAQATDVSVNKATKKLFLLAKTPAEMAALGEKVLVENIKSIGLYRNKAKNIIKLSNILIEKFNSNVPESLEQLQSLPGVGRKTANVVLNMAFGHYTIAVDTHVFRVSNRTKIAPGKNVEEVEDLLLKRIPKEFLLHAHHWLILHGRYVCKARRPLCEECNISDLCPSKI